MSLCTLIDSAHVQAGQEVIHPPLQGITECSKLNAWDKHTSLLLLLSDLSVAICGTVVGGRYFPTHSLVGFSVQI